MYFCLHSADWRYTQGKHLLKRSKNRLIYVVLGFELNVVKKMYFHCNILINKRCPNFAYNGENQNGGDNQYKQKTFECILFI